MKVKQIEMPLQCRVRPTYNTIRETKINFLIFQYRNLKRHFTNIFGLSSGNIVSIILPVPPGAIVNFAC